MTMRASVKRHYASDQSFELVQFYILEICIIDLSVDCLHRFDLGVCCR